MNDPRHIAVVTGTRAEFGLLRPVMRAVRDHDQLRLSVIVCGSHLLPPAQTVEEVAAEFTIDATIEMQRAGESGRPADASAFARGAAGICAWLADAQPDVILVLGDRIEAFAAASAASIAGIRVAHMHGGDRAEGIADEALRHAISKLAHIHFPATAGSAERLLCMGEEPLRVHLVGSPALDDLREIPPLSDSRYSALGRPDIILLLHPAGADEYEEESNAGSIIRLCENAGRTLLLYPNYDAGREGIVRAIEQAESPSAAHLPRKDFIGLLQKARVLVGNSSAGFIESAAVGVSCINLGPRQAGREMPGNVIDLPDWDLRSLNEALEITINGPRPTDIRHPYGDGTSGPRTAEVLATLSPDLHGLRKRNTY